MKFIVSVLTILHLNVISQNLASLTCPDIDKRSNGNGGWQSSPGYFPVNGQNNPVAPNIVGTKYQTVIYNPVLKTGNITFKWPTTYNITGLPIITRVWLTASGSTTPVLDSVKFGPPSPITRSKTFNYFTYHFYVNNLPAAGKITFEFSDPATGKPLYLCSYDLQAGTSTVTPPSLNCSPTIFSQPKSLNLGCNPTSDGQFMLSQLGADSIRWQKKSGSTWINLFNSGDYLGTNDTILIVKNPTTHNTEVYRALLYGKSLNGCTNTISDSVTLYAFSNPTATFITSSICGIGPVNVSLNLSGQAPFSINYNFVPTSGSTTNSSIQSIVSSPYSFQINPGTSGVLNITTVSDLNCINSSINSTFTLNSVPTVAVSSNPSICTGVSNTIINITTSGSPNQYSLISGIRTMPNFVNVSNASLSGSSISLAIPQNTPAGIYDFKLVVKNSTSGCLSDTAFFTLTIASRPLFSIGSTSYSPCANSTINLNVSPAIFSSYSWTLNNNSIGTSSQLNNVIISSNSLYKVQVVDNAGCTYLDSIFIQVSPNPLVSVTGTTSICKGDATLLTVTGGISYSWTLSNGSSAPSLSSASGSSVIAFPTSTTTYKVSVGNSNGCSASQNITVNVDSSTNLSVTPLNPTVCNGNIVMMTASGASSYKWYPVTGLYKNASATIAYAVGDTATIVYARPITATTYQIEGTSSGGCKNYVSSSVSISSSPIDSANTSAKNLVFCSQTSSTLPLKVTLTSSPSSTQWQYSTDGITYVNLPGSPTGVTLTQSSSGNLFILTLSSYGINYAGPRYFRFNYTVGTCVSSYDIQVTDIKASNSSAILVPIANSNRICLGSSTTVSLGDIGTNTVQWQSSSDSINYTNISGATTNMITISPTQKTFYKAVINNGNGNCGFTTTFVSVSVDSINGTNTISPSSICANGSSIIFSGSSINNGVYQWQMSTTSSTTGFSDIFGAFSQNYTLVSSGLTNILWIRRIASTGACLIANSNTAAVYPTITNNSISATSYKYCNTAPSLVLGGSLPLGGDNTYTYQWQKSSDSISFTNITGAQSQNYTTPGGETTKWFYRRLVSSGGCSNSTSPIVSISVDTKPTITISSSSTSICSGNKVLLNSSGALYYSWSSTGGANAGMSKVSGDSIYVYPTASSIYQVVGINNLGCTDTQSISISVNNVPSNPFLSTNQKVVCSSNLPFDLNTLVSLGSNIEWFKAPIASSSYSASSSINSSGYYYAFSKLSSCYSLSYDSVYVQIVNSSKPVPLSFNINSCSLVDLTLYSPAAFTNIIYQWHTTNINPSSSTVVSTPTSVNTGTYFLIPFSSSGNCYGIASDSVKVKVEMPVNATLNNRNVNLCAPNALNLNSLSSQSNNIWYSNKPFNQNTFIADPSKVAISGTFYVVNKNSLGCIGNYDSVIVTYYNPNLKMNPIPVKCYNDSETIVVIYSGITGGSFTWQSSSDLTSWNNLSGVNFSGLNTSNLVINNVSLLNASYIRANLSNSSCNFVSPIANVVFDSIISFNSSLLDIELNSGDSTVISLNYSGNGYVTWEISSDSINYTTIQDSVVFSGIYSNSLVINNINNAALNKFYRAKIINNCGTYYSNTFKVRKSFDTTIYITPPCPTCPVYYCFTGTGTPTYSVCGTPSGYTMTGPNASGCVTITPNAGTTTGGQTCVVKCLNGLCDTTYIVINKPITPDTNTVTPACPTCPVTTCVIGDDITGTGTPTYSVCGTPSGYTMTGPNASGCVTITPNAGTTTGGQTCVVKCLNGLCDTTYIIINKPITPDTNTVTPACPTCPVTTCVIGDDITGTGTPTYSVCGTPSGYTMTGPNASGCVTITPNAGTTTGGQTCIVKCLNGICDTTYIIINKPITPDTNTVTPACPTCPVTTCVIGDDITGTGTPTYSVCGTPSGYTMTGPNASGCVTITPNAGTTTGGQTCIVKCLNGICDTTYIFINLPTSLDSDGDGILDSIEKGKGTNPIDTDGDGIPDFQDLDSDNDGILDSYENTRCANTGSLCDTDGDGIPNYLDLDSDGDGISDVIEGNGIDANKDGKADGPSDSTGVPSSAGGGLTPPDTDGDTKTNPYDVDSDGDGILDSGEIFNGITLQDCDGDGIPDYIDADLCSEDAFPNYITPNGDGKNDFFVFPANFVKKYPNSKIVIFNRWGNIVWRSIGSYKNDWNGLHYDNNPLPDGVYYYLIELKDHFGEFKNGFIQIMRD